jgi:D-aminopeptidase
VGRTYKISQTSISTATFSQFAAKTPVNKQVSQSASKPKTYNPRTAMTLPTKTIRTIESIIASAVAENEPGIAVGIAQGGRIVWGGARGLANLQSQRAFAVDTPFRICSISKQFSCALVMREVAAGRIDLSLHPSRYVPWTKVLDCTLTIAHLMQNKSGIRDHWVMAMMMGARAEQRFTLADGVSVVEHAPTSMWAPGSQNLYCNANFEILGDVLQQVTGEGVAALLQKHIFTPLKMADTTLAIDTAEPIKGDTRGYRHIDGAWQEEENGIHWGASAGIVSTVEDLLKWAACLRDPNAAGLPWVADITRAAAFNDGNPATYACGITHAINGAREMLSHGGGLRGWRSTLMHFTAEDTSIALFMNRNNSPQGKNGKKGKMARGIAQEIMKALKIVPINAAATSQRGRATAVGAKLPSGMAGAYVSREQGLLIQLREQKGVAEVHSHLDWSALSAGAAKASMATDDGHLQIRVDSPSQLTLTMPDENVHTVMQRIKPAKVKAGSFHSGGRFYCAPIESYVEVFVDAQRPLQTRQPQQAELAFTGIFGEGVRYALTVVNDEFAWFDLSRGVDEAPPGRVLVRFDGVESALELSCMLTRRVVFRGVM